MQGSRREEEATKRSKMDQDPVGSSRTRYELHAERLPFLALDEEGQTQAGELEHSPSVERRCSQPSKNLRDISD